MKYALIRQRNCIASTAASHWAERCGEDVDVVYIEDTPEAAVLYGGIGVMEYPTLVRIGIYGIVDGRVRGFNERKYNALIGADNTEENTNERA